MIFKSVYFVCSDILVQLHNTLWIKQSGLERPGWVMSVLEGNTILFTCIRYMTCITGQETNLSTNYNKLSTLLCPFKLFLRFLLISFIIISLHPWGSTGHYDQPAPYMYLHGCLLRVWLSLKGSPSLPVDPGLSYFPLVVVQDLARLLLCLIVWECGQAITVHCVLLVV